MCAERKRSDEELARALAELLECDDVEVTDEEIDAGLREFGYDPDEVERRFRQVAEQALASSPLNWRNRGKDLQEERKRIDELQEARPPTIEEVKKQIRELLSTVVAQGKQPGYAYRNLDGMPEGDLATVLNDLRYLAAEESEDESQPRG